MNEFEALTNLANGPIIFTYYAEKELSISTLQYNGGGVVYLLQSGAIHFSHTVHDYYVSTDSENTEDRQTKFFPALFLSRESFLSREWSVKYLDSIQRE